MTNADEFEAALNCKTPEEAANFARAAAGRRVDAGVPEDKAKQMFLEDIGYMAGYYSPTIRSKVEELYGAVHPIFGHLRPTTEEALMLGHVTAALGAVQSRRIAEMLQARYLMPPPAPEPGATAKD